MNIRPFKLRTELINNFESLNVAQKVLGSPHNFSRNSDRCSCQWVFYDNACVYNLDISKSENANYLDISIQKEYFGNNNTISFNLKDYQPEFSEKLNQFISAVSKPWSEWLDEEIESDPMWIYYFFCENRNIPEQFHNVMVLFSYKEPDNTWVKRYFHAKNEVHSNSC